MALIPCPDCGRDVSDIAPTCPQCGRPIARQAVAVDAVGEPLITVQATSKHLKSQMLLALAVLSFGLGCFVLYYAMEPGDRTSRLWSFGEVLFWGGFLWYFVCKARIWWEHG